MADSSEKSILTKFIWQYQRIALLYAAFIGIFAIIFHLYGMEAEVEAVLYAGGLCALLGILALGVAFCSCLREHRFRRKRLGSVEILEESTLPPPRTLAEEDDQALLLRLKEAYDTGLAERQKERRESMDYYATWMHQVKTPISAMRMTLQEEDTEEHREVLAELFRIEQYVEMALNWLRLGSDVSDFVFQEYALDGIIRQAIHKYAPLFIRRCLRLSYEPVEVTVLTDEKWLLFIIEQILSNAVKYTRQGGVTITVTQEGVLRIADTGIGIAPEDVPRIFEKGFTGYNGRADKKSTGLGLYLCRLAADRLSHRLSVESEVGVGTTFVLDLRREALLVE